MGINILKSITIQVRLVHSHKLRCLHHYGNQSSERLPGGHGAEAALTATREGGAEHIRSERGAQIVAQSLTGELERGLLHGPETYKSLCRVLGSQYAGHLLIGADILSQIAAVTAHILHIDSHRPTVDHAGHGSTAVAHIEVNMRKLGQVRFAPLFIGQLRKRVYPPPCAQGMAEQQVGTRMNGLSLHYYTVAGWTGSKGKATSFTDDDYFFTLGKCREIEDVIKRHCQIMDQYDHQKRVALMLDEWGTWWDVEEGTNPGHLFQQNTLRDAFVASLTFDIFHKYTDRLKMANIAQIVNVLQSMILTKGDQMVLTPTYYVFKMYNVHQDATYLPLQIISDQVQVRGNRTVPMLSATASQKDGKTHISLSNVDPNQKQTVTISLGGLKANRVSGEMLTSAHLTDYNDFGKAEVVHPQAFNGAKIQNGVLTVELPAKSIVTLELQ